MEKEKAQDSSLFLCNNLWHIVPYFPGLSPWWWNV